jgi:quercetin dioxygenase-like cupin family protein
MAEKRFIPDWREAVVYGEEGPQPQVLVDRGGFRVVLAGLRPGQRIPPHPEGLAVYHFLKGKGWMIVDGERNAVSAGATVIVPQGASRGMEADTELAFIASRVAQDA